MGEPKGPARWSGEKRSVRASGQDDGTDVSWTDAAKALADEHGIDITTVEGTGADGNVTKADVQAVVDAQG